MFCHAASSRMASLESSKRSSTGCWTLQFSDAPGRNRQGAADKSRCPRRPTYKARLPPAPRAKRSASSTSSICTQMQCKATIGTARIVQRIRKVGSTASRLGPRLGRNVASSYIVQSLVAQGLGVAAWASKTLWPRGFLV